jgi:uroporphyrinogen III methyltransferase/synthase
VSRPRRSATSLTRGIVYLVGAGPGDPGLLTVRGRELLTTCDAVVYDALANPVLLQHAVAQRADGNIAELHEAGKRGGASESAKQDDINALLVRLAREGKRVVRLKGGDPFVFGRGSEEAQALAAADIPFEVVPGVTAGIAAAAYAGIPVTHRAVATSVTFVTGHEDPSKEAAGVNWAALARAGGTIVLYMGVRALPRIAEQLVAGGMPPETPAAAIQWGTLARQRTLVATVTTLAHQMAEAKLSAPVITIIGPVVSLHEQVAWFEARPLFGRCIVVTRAHTPLSTLAARLAEAGAEIIEMPATRIVPLDQSPLHAAIDRLPTYDWLVFTSQNAVELFWEALRRHGADSRAFARAKLAAVGPSTAEALFARGLVVDVTPERFVAEGLLDAFGARDDVRGARVLYAAAQGARDVLPTGLSALGAHVDVVPIYRTERVADDMAPVRARLELGEVDLVTFTSASAVHAFVAAVGVEAARRAPAASIGPVTTEAAREAGLEVIAEASESTISGLVDAIVGHVSGVRAASRA